MDMVMSLQTNPSNGAAQDLIYEEVSKHSVLDAAFYLWKERRRLDFNEGSPLFSKVEPTPDVSKPRVLHDLIASTVSTLQHERQTAPEGSTLHRLVRAHPELTEEAAKDAISRAVKLDDAGTTALISLGYELQSVQRAVEIARDANPGFSEKVYRSLWHELAYAASK